MPSHGGTHVPAVAALASGLQCTAGARLYLHAIKIDFGDASDDVFERGSCTSESGWRSSEYMMMSQGRPRVLDQVKGMSLIINCHCCALWTWPCCVPGARPFTIA
jgi:hypothetical protein